MIELKEIEDEDKIFGESYDSEEESVVSEHASEIEIKNYGSEGEDESFINHKDKKAQDHPKEF